MLHGSTQSPEDFAAGTRMNFLAEEQDCLVVYPAQGSDANKAKCWNWFPRSDQQRDKGEPSLVAGITGQIMDDYSVDPGRVYVGGMSAGAAAAAIMRLGIGFCVSLKDGHGCECLYFDAGQQCGHDGTDEGA